MNDIKKHRGHSGFPVYGLSPPLNPYIVIQKLRSNRMERPIHSLDRIPEKRGWKLWLHIKKT